MDIETLTAILIVITAVYAGTTIWLALQARTARHDRRKRETNEQARLVGGYIEAYASVGTYIKIRIHVINASPLPVRDLWARLFAPDPNVLADAEEIEERMLPVVEPHRERTIEVRVRNDRLLFLHLELEFDDENGRRWRKYGDVDEPLKRVPPRRLDGSSGDRPEIDAQRNQVV